MRFEVIMALSFSNIVFLLNCFKINHAINAMLYLCNISALLATLAMLYLKPTFQRDRAEDYFHVALPLVAFNAAIIAWHVLPVYLFRRRQTLRELVNPRIIAGAALMWLSYFALMSKKNMDWLYSMTPANSAILFATLLVFYFSVHAALNWV